MATAMMAADAGDLPDWLDAEDVLGGDDDEGTGQGRDAAPPMWQTAQEGYNDGGELYQHQERALAIASTSNAAAAAAPSTTTTTSSSSCSPEDAAFADVLAETMQGHLSPAEAVKEYALICERAADAARREAQGLLGGGGGPSSDPSSAAGAAPSAAARRAAAARSSALESEAATWRLLSWLHGDPDPCVPAGRVVDAFGGGKGGSKGTSSLTSPPPSRLLSASAAAGAASSPSSSSLSSLTGAQRAALAIASDPTLNRLARVVAWLEASARRALAAADEGAAAAGGVAGGGDALLFPGDGLPRDTALRSSSKPGAAVPDLDPDAGTRALLGAGVAIGATGTAGTTAAAAAVGAAAQLWSRADEEASARLCSRLRCLLRAGRGRDAVALCARVGAHWRGVSLGSAAGPGLVALGEEAVENGDAENAADALAAEADLGAGTLRALWRSAAAAAPPGSAAAASAAAEAALYGVLGGDPAAALLLLDGGGGAGGGGGRAASSSLDQGRRSFPGGAAAAGAASDLLPARPSPWHDALWVLARCWLEAEVDAVVASSSSSSSSSSNSNSDRRCEGVVAGSQAKRAWPPRHLADAVPRSPGELLSAAAAAAAPPSASSMSRGAFGGSPSVAAAEAHKSAQEALVAGGEALLSFVADRLPRWAGAGGGDEAAAGAAAGAAAAAAVGGGLVGGGARFAAHFALALADLGLIPDPADPLPPPAAARRVVDAANAAIALHCVSLIDSGSGGEGGVSGSANDFAVDAGNLLPPLAVRAAAPFRRDIIGLRLRTLRDAPAEDAAQALEALDQWLQGWASTVAAAASSSPSPSSSLLPPPVSDIAPGEMERHAAAAASAGRHAGSAREGPAGRAAAARWLWLSPRTLAAAAEHSCRVLRELFLSGGGGAASAARALLAGLPAEPAAVVGLSPTEILAAAEELRGGRRAESRTAAATAEALSALSALGPGAASLPRRTFACLAELAAWRALLLADRAWRSWRADYAAAEAARPRAPSAAALARLRAGAEALADDLPSLVASGWLQGCLGKGDSSRSSEEGGNALVPAEPSPDGEPGEVVLELLLELLSSPPSATATTDGGGGEASFDAAAAAAAAAGDCDDDSRYRLSSPEACAAGAAALSASLSAALPEGVVATAAPAEGADSGLVAVRVRLAEGAAASASAASAAAVAAAASAAVVVKGALAPATSSAASPPPPPRVRVACLRAASGEAARALCLAVALPRLLLRAAAAREAAVALGSPLDPGTAAVELAADPGIAPLFSRGEVQSLLERERRAVISAMVNDEARS